VHSEVVMGNSIHRHAFFLCNYLLRTLFRRIVTILFGYEELIVLISHRPVVHSRLEAHTKVGHAVRQWVTNFYLFFQGQLFWSIGMAR